MADAILRFRDDAPYDGPVVTLADLADSNAGAVRLAPGEDARHLIPRLSQLRLVEISYPTFRDGRGYSAARILREAGFAGELRAVGDVLVDQLPFMRRVGFDGFAPNAPLDPAAVERALGRYEFVYQAASDARSPVWRLRHG